MKYTNSILSFIKPWTKQGAIVYTITIGSIFLYNKINDRIIDYERTCVGVYYGEMCKNPVAVHFECTGNICEEVKKGIDDDLRFTIVNGDKEKYSIKIIAKAEEVRSGKRKFYEVYMEGKSKEFKIERICNITSLFGYQNSDYRGLGKKCIGHMGIKNHEQL